VVQEEAFRVLLPPVLKECVPLANLQIIFKLRKRGSGHEMRPPHHLGGRQELWTFQM